MLVHYGINTNVNKQIFNTAFHIRT